MLVHRDPKRAAIAPLTKGQSWTNFCVQLTLGTYPGPVWNKEATQNGLVLVGARFTETKNGISCNSFDVRQIDSYPTMRKNSLT